MDEAFAAAERLRANMENSGTCRDFPVTTSIGAAGKFSGESSDDWFKRLDQALYRAKLNAGNQVAV
jgi:GGDEF domain-containing protein